ncbi:unnamed protein product [Ilex paraguariensis]|uniref:Uncharacterized protein n=1 Tax=Ilex paraguariensis TaxID=185542 RepID=A0ABC8S6N8_9AQUA
MFSIEKLDFDGVPDKHSSSENFGSGLGGNISKQPQFDGEQDWGESGGINSFCSDVGFFQDDIAEEEIHREQQLQLFSQLGSLDDLYFDIVSPPLQPCHEEFSKLVDVHSDSSETAGELSVLSHPYASSFLGLSDEEAKGVELVQCLLTSAEKVSQQQFECAIKLLDQCDASSYYKGNTVQRLVYHFSEALREKIDRETGRVSLNGLGRKQLDLKDAMMSPNSTIVSFYQKVPFTQVCLFTGVQAIVENIAEAKKVHLIDLEIQGGVHCMILMEALVARHECALEHMKITAIGTKSKPKIEEAGKRLISFAESMNISFSFNVVMVADMLDLNEGLFVLDDEEAVVVYSIYLLTRMITWPDRLECLMRLMRNINPSVIVVTELEANHNSPVFVNRFIETLFFYAAFFDSMEDCMSDDEPNRTISESLYFIPAIRNIVAAEGEERTIRQVNINVWRTFFTRFGMVEMSLSKSALYQAELMLKNFACGSSCTLELDGKSLLIGWKGTPIESLSAWKFQ